MDLTPINSTVFAPRTRGVVKDFFSNHGWALFLSHRRRLVDFCIGVKPNLFQFVYRPTKVVP
jgi:hypothetical protein